jgi:lia operon protein LiaG
MHSPTLKSTLRTTAAAALLIAAAQPALAQRHTLAGSDVAVYNLVGTMTVTGGTGGQVTIDVSRRGRDAARLEIATGRIGGRETLRLVPPGGSLIYPELGRGSRTTVQVGRDGTFGDGARGRSVTVAGSGSGVEAWADLAVSVPAGRTVRLYTAVGSIDVSNVQGALHVHTSSASSRVREVRGPVELRSSSGSVEIAGVQGAVSARASSGSIRAENLRGGRHEIRTSSGGITLRGADGEAIALTASSGNINAGELTARSVEAEASSGSVTLQEVSADRLHARASSGRVRALGIAAAEVELRASSGSIELGAVTPPRTLSITGSSGSVRAALPSDFGGSVDIRTSSGSISSELPVETTSVRRNELVGRIGRGSSTLQIRAASGSVRLTRS